MNSAVVIKTQIFKNKIVAICNVTDGIINAHYKICVIRDGIVIFEDGELESIKRYKEDIGQVKLKQGDEFGLIIKDWNYVEIGDVISQ